MVLGGTPEGLAAAADAARACGVRKVRPLAVGGAFHTPLMAQAAGAFQEHVLALLARREAEGGEVEKAADAPDDASTAIGSSPARSKIRRYASKCCENAKSSPAWSTSKE